MSVTATSLGIDRLSREERLALVQEIWDGLALENHSPFLSDVQRQELARRVADDDANPDEVIPWEQVKAQTLARLRNP